MADALSSTLGRALGRNYRIERELGGGGMSRVFLADEEHLGRKVVIKVLPPETAGHVSAERFLREIQIAARLQHPNIVPVLGAGEADGILYYTMPFVDGETLQALLERDRRLPVALAVQLALEVADALSYAHDHGVVHRDVKPANIVLSSGHALVLDFGIARALDASGHRAADALTGAGVSVGTPAYMSPEQSVGEADIDGRSDLYSLGTMLYEAIAGRLPFEGATSSAVIARRLTENPVSLRALDASVPSQVDSAVMRALASAPDERFRHVSEFSAHLRAREQHEERPKIEVAATAPASVAVLPFTNLSGDADTDYFSDGVTEEITNALARVPGLRVAARTTSFAFKGQNIDVTAFARRLNVAMVLEGSVRRSANRLRITARCISAADGETVWSERFDRELKDIFDIQEDIARAVAEQLKLRLTAPEQRAIFGKGTRNLDAYDLYLKGRYAWARRGEGLRVAVGLFDQAIALDPGFAAAHAGLADAYTLRASYGYQRAAMVPQARIAAYAALSLDDTLAESHYAVGAYELWLGLDVSTAERALARSAELNQSWGIPLGHLSLLRSAVGRLKDAEIAADEVFKREPLSAPVVALASLAFSLGTSYDKGLRTATRALELEPTNAVANMATAIAYSGNGQLSLAVEAFERAVQLSARSPLLLAFLGGQYAIAQRTADARNVLSELETRDAWPYHSAVVLWHLGEEDAALAKLEVAAQLREVPIFCLLAFSRLHSFVSDSRWHGILRHNGLAQIAAAYEGQARCVADATLAAGRALSK